VVYLLGGSGREGRELDSHTVVSVLMRDSDDVDVRERQSKEEERE